MNNRRFLFWLALPMVVMLAVAVGIAQASRDWHELRSDIRETDEMLQSPSLLPPGWADKVQQRHEHVVMYSFAHLNHWTGIDPGPDALPYSTYTFSKQIDPKTGRSYEGWCDEWGKSPTDAKRRLRERCALDWDYEFGRGNWVVHWIDDPRAQGLIY